MGNQSPELPIPSIKLSHESIPTGLPTHTESTATTPSEPKPSGDISIAPSKTAPLEMPPKEKKPSIIYGAAELTLPIQSLLRNCGIDVSTVNPISVGEGANHVVYLATPKNGEPFVIKIPKNNSPTSINRGHEDETSEIQKIQKAFPGYSLDAETKIDPETNKYIVIQRAVDGKPITNRTSDPSLKAQLSEIVALNRNLFEHYGESLDFVGMPGFVSWIRHQFRKLITRKSEFEISNLLIDAKTNRIHIIDTDVLRLHDNSLRTSLISRIGFFVNRILMKHYFKLDIKHE